MTSRRPLVSSSSSQRAGTAAPAPSWEGFQKLFASVADPQTQSNHARHLALAKNVLYENELGQRLPWLAFRSQKRFDGLTAVGLLSQPFIRHKSNEEISNPTLLHPLLLTLGELLSFDDIDVQVAAAEALRQFATGACLARTSSKTRSSNIETNVDDLRLTPRVFSQNLMEETGTVDAIVAVMHDLFPDDEAEIEQPQQEDQEEWQPSTEVPDPTGNQTDQSTAEERETNHNGEEHEANTGEDDFEKPSAAPCAVTLESLSFKQDEGGSTRTKKPASAPPHALNRGGVIQQHDDTLATSSNAAAVRASKPSSAPSAIRRRSNGNGEDDAALHKSHTAPIDGNPTSLATSEQPDAESAVTEQHDSASAIEPDNEEAGASASGVEEELGQVIGNTIPPHLRLSTLLFPLIDLLYELSSHQRCAEVLVVTGALHYIVFILENITDPQDELLSLCLLILWNVLELSHEKMAARTKCSSRKKLLERFRLRNATFFLGNEFTFRALLHVLELLLAHGYRQQDKELRNECLMILQLLSKRRRSLDCFYSTGLTACLLSYATAAELSHAKAMGNASGAPQVGQSSATAAAITASSQHYATNSDEDFEFKQMLWFLLAEITCGHDANLSELVQFRFLDVWMSYATTNYGGGTQEQDINALPPRASAYKYSVPQLQLLQTTALSVLNHVTPFVLEHFYELEGHVKLLEFLQLNMGSEDVLSAAWFLMVQISPPLPFCQAELGTLGAVETAVEIFQAPPSRHTFAIRRNAILACANMCRNDNGANRKQFLHANGVHALVGHLEFDPSHSVLEENILIGIIDAVRSCVVGDSESETTFINADGVPKLLAILGPSPKAVKHQVLAALAEICVNPAAIPSYQTWHSVQPGINNNASANQVLLRIYADEEAAEKRAIQDEGDRGILAVQGSGDLVASTNVRHSAFQSVTNCRSPFIITPEATAPEEPPQSPTERPESPAFARLKEALKAAQGLSLEKQATRTILQLEDNQVHPEVNLKAKIHSVLTNVSFACDVEGLTPHDQVMLEIAKEYPTFKLGEMWLNVQRALHAEGVRPIYADALYISKQIEHAYNVSVCTKLAQQEVFTRTHQQTAELEDAFFKQILRQKQQEAQAEEFHRANRRHNSTMQLHFDAKKTRLEFMRRQDPAAFAAFESEERCRIHDPPPKYVDETEAWRALQMNEEELRGRLSTITRSRKHSV
ncbi:hypothetical protein BBJ28_00001096 [Nothophytophthora sp. Chile5]|nr:hypothetical protein BBJ28_00001096 [Nothophytophthora sp. Chile5]